MAGVRVHVVSDVHGEHAALATAGDGADLFVCLGDLILFLDYDDPERGIYADLLGADHARAYIEARTAGRFEDARELSAAAWARRGILDPQERFEAIRGRVRAQYEAMFAVMPAGLLTYGNVDLPDLWADHLGPDHRVVDGQVVVVDGIRMGFVGGGLVSPMRTPYELSEEDYAAKVDALGEVDVLFTHIPPSLPALTYDVVARRFEFGSARLLEYVMDTQPAIHCFGHVHQPLRQRMRVGRTECVNVGHFHGRRRPLALDL